MANNGGNGYGGRTQYGYYTIETAVEKDEYDDATYGGSPVYAEKVAENETFKSCVGNGAKEYLNKLWLAHPGKFLGMGIGLLIGILILIFGFFPILFIVICGAIGLVIGSSLDHGGDWLENLRKMFSSDIHRWR